MTKPVLFFICFFAFFVSSFLPNCYAEDPINISLDNINNPGLPSDPSPLPFSFDELSAFTQPSITLQQGQELILSLDGFILSQGNLSSPAVQWSCVFQNGDMGSTQDYWLKDEWKNWTSTTKWSDWWSDWWNESYPSDSYCPSNEIHCTVNSEDWSIKDYFYTSKILFSEKSLNTQDGLNPQLRGNEVMTFHFKGRSRGKVRLCFYSQANDCHIEGSHSLEEGSGDIYYLYPSIIVEVQ